MKKLGTNIKINYIFHFFMNIRITQGIWMIYLVSRGLNLFEVGLLEGIFHITSFIMETPTGAVADLFGRKISRLTGLVFSVTSSVLMILSGSFWGFALSFAMSALSYNFESGAGEALIYDSLKAEKQEHLFMKITGHNETIFQIAGIIALLFGGIIGSIEYIWVYYISIGIAVISFLVGLFFKEPPKKENKERLGVFASIKGQYIDSFEVIRTKRKLSYLLLFSALLAMMITLSFFYLQVAWKTYGFIEWQIGLILAIASVFSIAGALVAEKVDQKYGEEKLLKVIPFIVAGTLFMFFNEYLSIGAFAVASFVDSLLFVTLRDYINRIIPSDKRATIISFESTCFSFFMILIFPVFGFLSDRISMAVTFVILGGLMLVLSVINVRVFYKK